MRRPLSPARTQRDWVDYVLLVIQALGLIAVVVTIIITLQTNASNNADSATALANLAEIASSSKGQKEALVQQVQALNGQVTAVRDTAGATRDLVAKTGEQVSASVRSVEAAQKAGGIAQGNLNAAIRSLQLQQTSHLALSVHYKGQNKAGELEGNIIIRNVGGPIIYEAEAKAAMVMLPIGRGSEAFKYLNGGESMMFGPKSAINQQRLVIIPSDEPTYLRVRIPKFDDVDLARIAQGLVDVTLVASVTYRDESGKPHNRYICESFGIRAAELTYDVCETPRQR